jgi:hypothetical protein
MLSKTEGRLAEAQPQITRLDLARKAEGREMRELLVHLVGANIDVQTNSPFRDWLDLRIGTLFYILQSGVHVVAAPSPAASARIRARYCQTRR